MHLRSLAASVPLAILIPLASSTAHAEPPPPRAVAVQLALPLVSSVSFEGGDEGLDASLRLDVGVLWQRPGVSFGVLGSLWRWNNPTTEAHAGGASHLLAATGVFEVHGSERGGPYARLGLGLALSSLSDDFALDLPSDLTFTIVKATAPGVSYELSAGWRFRVGEGLDLTAALGLRGATAWHRAMTTDGSGGSLSEKALSLGALDASIGLQF